jgi:hypothetical protein
MPQSSSIEPFGQVYDRLHTAQGISKGGRVGQVAERYLNAHALGAQAPRVAHQAAHLDAFGQQARQQRRADQACRTREQHHDSYNMRLRRATSANRPKERSEWPT